MLPANEIEPIMAERTIAIEPFSGSRPGAGAELWKSANAISAAAPPPTPLNSATICGIAVIFTARAAYAPIGAEITITTTIAADVLHARLEERGQDRHGHPEGADQVASARVRRDRTGSGARG